MKNTLVGMAFLSLAFLVSCKKEYTCNCDVTATSTTSADMSEYDGIDDFASNTFSYTNALDKTSKAVAKSNCLSQDDTQVTYYSDDLDLDGDGNTSERAYTTTATAKTDCTLSK